MVNPRCFPMTERKTSPGHASATRAASVRGETRGANATGKRVGGPERRRRRRSAAEKRDRVYDIGAGKSNDALGYAIGMAWEFFTIRELLRRVHRAQEHPEPYDGECVPTSRTGDQDSGVLDLRASRLMTAQELAAQYSLEELAEIMKNLRAGLSRHADAYLRGYGDALRSNRVRAEARRLKGISLGIRMPIEDERPWSDHKSNLFIARMLAIGTGRGPKASLNESSVRRLLKPIKEKHRFYLDEFEPRGKRKTAGEGAP